MPWPKTGATYYHAQLGPLKGSCNQKVGWKFCYSYINTSYINTQNFRNTDLQTYITIIVASLLKIKDGLVY